MRHPIQQQHSCKGVPAPDSFHTFKSLLGSATCCNRRLDHSRSVSVSIRTRDIQNTLFPLYTLQSSHDQHSKDSKGNRLHFDCMSTKQYANGAIKTCHIGDSWLLGETAAVPSYCKRKRIHTNAETYSIHQQRSHESQNPCYREVDHV